MESTSKKTGRKINVAIIGTIGVGKSTFVKHLSEEAERRGVDLLVDLEPSVTIQSINDILERFYKDMEPWAYPLQLSIAAANEVQLQEAKGRDYDVMLFDSPYSAFEYCRIHAKHGRITDEEKNAIDAISRPFPFDYVILIKETKEKSIERIKRRNGAVEKKSNALAQADVPIKDFDYVEEHMKDYNRYLPEYLDKKFPKAERIEINGLPEEKTPEYGALISQICEHIVAFGQHR